MNVNITTLDNGLRVAIDKVDYVQSVAIAVFVNTGSRNESLENNGISHFLEHMAFKGTKKRNAREIAEQFDDIGGKINAYTSRGKTVYYVKVLKQDVEFATEFLADILQNSIFDEGELEKERGVILQEIAMTNDTPDDIIFDYFWEAAFPHQSIGRSILGPEENIKKFNRKHFFDYISQQYNYSDIAVVASGNVEEEQFIKLVTKYFNNLGKNKIQNFDKAKYQGSDLRKNKDLEQINLLLGFESISYLDNDFYKAQMLAAILGGGMSSRLFQEVREKRGLAYSTYSFNSSAIDHGLFAIYIGTTEEKVNEAIKVISDEILKITENITDEEVKRVIKQNESSLLMNKENIVSRSQKLGSDILAYNRLISEEEVISKIKAISKKDIMDFAGRLFINSNINFSAIGKIDNIPDYYKINQQFS